MKYLQRIILIRHAQSTLNVKKKLSGHTDPPLTELGKEQAAGLANMLAGRKIDRILSSPFSRTMDTARPIAQAAGLEIETHDGLKEQNFGDWEGKGFEEIFELMPNGPEGLLRGPFLTRFPSGEGTEMFIARVIGTYRDFILEGSEGKTIAVVTHGGFIVGLLCHFLGIDPYLNFFRFRISNASATMVDRYGLGLFHVHYVNRTQ